MKANPFSFAINLTFQVNRFVDQEGNVHIGVTDPDFGELELGPTHQGILDKEIEFQIKKQEEKENDQDNNKEPDGGKSSGADRGSVGDRQDQPGKDTPTIEDLNSLRGIGAPMSQRDELRSLGDEDTEGSSRSFPGAEQAGDKEEI